MENFTPNTNQDSNSNFSGEVKDFYKNDFKNLLTSIFKNPTEGVYRIFADSTNAYKNALILYLSIIVLFFVETYLIIGEARKYIEISQLIKVSIIPALLMFVISIVSFLIKSISSKADFKSELLTGGLCAIPIGVLMTLLLLLKILGTFDDIGIILRNPLAAGKLVALFLFYFILMLINILQQSLKSSGTKDAIAWYLAPIGIILSYYLTYLIANEIFF